MADLLSVVGWEQCGDEDAVLDEPEVRTVGVGAVLEHLEVVEAVVPHGLIPQEQVPVGDERGAECRDCPRRRDKVLSEEEPRVWMIEGNLLNTLHQLGLMPRLGA